MKRRDFHFAFSCAAVLAVFITGCGGDDSAEGQARSINKPRLIIETGGYPPGPVPAIRHMVQGGLFALGDIDGDACTDMVVSSGKYPGSFGAFSGKNGKELWRVKALVGREAEASPEKAYTVAWVFLAGDVDSDGLRDIFFQNNWNRKDIFLVSGRDGSRLAAGDAGQVAPAARYEDMNADGVDDIVCVYHRISSPRAAERSYELNLGARVFSGRDLSEVALYESVVDLGEWQSRADWILGRFDDMNSDGVDEFVVGYETQDSQEVIFLSGKDMAELSRVSITRDKVRASRSYACGGDLDGDGTADLVKASKAGRGKEGRVSYLAAYSGADGRTLWEVSGAGLPGGREGFTVDVKTGEKRALLPDVEFGDTAVILPDLDGDTRQEIAAALPAIIKGKRQPSVLIFSGATGTHIATITYAGKDFRINGGQMALLENADGAGTPGLAVSGKVSAKKWGVAVFPLKPIK